MDSFTTLAIPPDADEAMKWAAMREYTLREQRRLGMIWHLQEITKSFQRLGRAFAGIPIVVDPSLPTGRVELRKVSP